MNEAEQVLEAVKNLHARQVRYMPYADAEFSHDTAEESLEYAQDCGDEEMTLETVPTFDICAECGRIEMAVQYDDASYMESLWPCSTAKALGVTDG